MNISPSSTAWKTSYRLLTIAWVLGAVLAFKQQEDGLVSSYLADVTNPPWLYIFLRGLAFRTDKFPRFLKWFGETPTRTAVSIFLVGIAYEFGQLLWPRSIFAGTF